MTDAIANIDVLPVAPQGMDARIHASQLIDPEDLLLNTSINSREYNHRVSCSRAVALLCEDWWTKFAAHAGEVILESLDVSWNSTKNPETGEVTEEETFHGTCVYVNDHTVCVLFISTSNQVFFHIWSKSREKNMEYCRWIKDNLFTEKIHNVFDEKTKSRDFSFWSLGPQGYNNVTRKIALLDWETSVEQNYPKAVLEHLTQFKEMEPPIIGGKVVMLHGEPGTGKTSFLRSLACHWTKWCHTSTIMDAENFLGMADAMMGVAGWDFSKFIDKSVDPANAYHAIILEDADELIGADARDRSGQRLGRLLNLGDGLLGQSANILIFITTNKKVKELNEALVRPGRCLAQIHFDAFPYEEALEWVVRHNPELPAKDVLPKDKNYTLAELYQAVSTRKQIVKAKPEAARHGTYL